MSDRKQLPRERRGNFARGLLAAAAGLVDFLTIAHVRSLTAGWVHLIGDAAALAVSWLLRLTVPAAAALPAGIILSAMVVGILGVTGWYGGELSYRHKIGVIGEG